MPTIRMLFMVAAAAGLMALGGVAWSQELSPPAPAAPPPAAAPTSRAAPPTATPASAEEAPPRTSAWEIFQAGGICGTLIVLLSVAALALAIEHIMTIRASVLMPPGLAEDVRNLLVAGKVGSADQRCRMQPSFLAHVLGAGLAEADAGWPAMEKAMEDAVAEQSARLFRKIEYLSVIANIATMLGLLGTVIGLIIAFRQVAITQGAARAADLAEGIYLALVTTVEGLIVAIPSLGAFAIFRNRVDHLVAELTYVAQHVFTPLKRGQAGAPPRSPAKAAPATRAPVPPPVGGGV